MRAHKTNLDLRPTIRVTQTPDSTRLQELDHGIFFEIVTAFVAAHWDAPEKRLEVAPPSPDRGIEVRLPDDGLVRVFQYAPPAVVSENAIRELAVFDESAVVTTTGFTEGARALARSEDLTLIDGEQFCRLLADYGIAIPEPEGFDLDAQITELAGHWSDSLADIARETAATIDTVGEFEYDLSRADYSTDLDAIPVDGTEPVAKLRFSPAGLRLYVRRQDWERVVGVSTHGEHVPPDLQQQVSRAIESLD